MTKNQILQNLCYYDEMNPDCVLDGEELKEYQEKINKNKKAGHTGCACDNCFYGRTRLAEEILRFIGHE